MKQNKTTFKIKSFLFIMISFFVIFEGLSYTYIWYHNKQNIAFIEKRNSLDFQTHINFAQSYLTQLAQVFYDTKINTPQMRKIMYEASITRDKEKRAELRAQLYKEFRMLYGYMRKQSVRQLHFHLPRAVSFLRFHRPNKFGDSLVGVRPTIDYVDKHYAPIHGFEEGRIFNGFRNVYPIFYHDTFVGTVEISYSFDAIKEATLHVEESAMVFLMNSNIVKTKVFASEESNYLPSEFKTLSYDKKILKKQTLLSKQELHAINRLIAPRVEKKLGDNVPFSILFQNDYIANGRNLVISFIPVFNIQDKQVAYVINYAEDHIGALVKQKNDFSFVVLSLFSLLLSGAIATIVLMLQRKHNDVYAMATHDELTGVLNRHGLNTVLLKRISEHERYGRAISFVFFDIDHFKKVNDTYGHKAGDVILQELCALVERTIRFSDILVRWGGEEFLIVLPETALAEAILLAEKLRIRIAEHQFSRPEHITCSFGVTELNDGELQEDVLKRVDEFLYRAKELGRNRIISDISLEET